MKKIQIFGTGCPKCNKLYEVAEKAAKELEIEYTMEKVSDINEIVNAGIMSTPAMAVDGEIKVAGKVPSSDAMKEMLS